MEKINEIEKAIDSFPERPWIKAKSKRRNRTKYLGLILVVLVSATLATAGLISYFGSVHTTVNAKQSIVISEDGTNWNDWDQTVQRTIDCAVHCTDYCYKLWIWNRACVDALADIVETPSEEGIEVSHWIFGGTQTVTLNYKDGNWDVISPESYVNITINTCSPTFNYTIDYYNLDWQEPYTLVYYIDQDPRFDVWGKVYVIENLGTLSGSGQIIGSHQQPGMPFPDDWNAGPDADYATSDGYEHAKGAKLWIVPTSNLESDTELQISQLNGWRPAYYLFETDLILYIDCDEIPPICLKYVFPEFNTWVLKAESKYCWITCYHVDFYIAPGQHIFDSILYASPIVP